MRFRWSSLVLVLSMAIAAPAAAQQESIHWHHDLESAKSMAKESGRLVLIHFWTPTCGPCAALEQNVFSQPGVAGAVEAVYVPVKLNADENTATAQWYGINRVPMDVVISPDGQLVGKMVSPPTAGAYVAEVTGLANKYATMSGQAYAAAAAKAPVQPQINAAYANLQLPPTASMPLGPPSSDPTRNGNGLATHGVGAPASGLGTQTGAPATQTQFGPQVVTNPAASKATTPQSQVAAPPAQVSNPYIGATASPPPASAAPAAPLPAAPFPSVSAATAQLGTAPAGATPGVSPAAAAVGPPLASGNPDPNKLPPGSPPSTLR